MPDSLCFCNNSLVIERNAPDGDMSRYQVLVVDPATFTPTSQLDLPAALGIRALSGSVGSKYLLAVDQDGQTFTAFDLGSLPSGSSQREAKMTRIPIPHPRSGAGLQQLAVTPDGKTVVYHDPNYLALLNVENSAFSLAGPLQGPIGLRDQVHASSNSQRLIYRMLADSQTSRGTWEIHDLSTSQEPDVTFPFGATLFLS